MSSTTLLIGLGIIAATIFIAFFSQRLKFLDHPNALWFVAISTGLVAFANSWYALWRHWHYESHAFDLGIFDQAVWHLSRFATPESTVRGIANIFGDHFHPIILLLAPFYWIVNSPSVLIVAQALLFASIIPLSYILARLLRIERWPAAILSFAFGITPGFVPGLGFDFHEIAFAVPLLLLAFIIIERKSWRWFALIISLLILTKESMPIYVIAIGLFLLFRKLWRIGTVTIITALVSFFIITKIIIPSFSDITTFRYWEQYEHLAASPQAVPLAIITHPRKFITAYFDTPEKLRTEKFLFAPFAGLPILSLTTLPLILVTLTEHFWSDFPPVSTYQFHYQILAAATFTIATLYALGNLKKWLPPLQRSLPPATAVLVLCLTVWTATKNESIRILWNKEVRSRPITLWNRELQLIPKNAAVSTQDAFVPHLSERQFIYRLPEIDNASFIILDPRAPSFPISSADVRALEIALKQDPAWKVISHNGDFMIFQRIQH